MPPPSQGRAINNGRLPAFMPWSSVAAPGSCRPPSPSCRSGWVVMGERQVLAGYCLLLPDPVVPHLNALEGGARTQFLVDMALVGDVLLAVTGAVRINYAIYGNVDPALHAHLFPRSGDEPETTRTVQPLALDWNAAPRIPRRCTAI